MTAILAKEKLNVGDIVAIRGVRDGRGNPRRIVQLSLYTADTYIGTLARADDGRIVRGADPWVRDDLFNLSGGGEVAQPGRQYRLLDAIYSTAARNGVPTGVLGEAIMLLSRSFDLEAFASTSDKLILAYARAGEGRHGRARPRALRRGHRATSATSSAMCSRRAPTPTSRASTPARRRRRSASRPAAW